MNAEDRLDRLKARDLTLSNTVYALTTEINNRRQARNQLTALIESGFLEYQHYEKSDAFLLNTKEVERLNREIAAINQELEKATEKRQPIGHLVRACQHYLAEKNRTTIDDAKPAKSHPQPYFYFPPKATIT